MQKDFTIEKVYYIKGKQVAYDVKVIGRKVSQYSKEECLNLFHSEAYNCVNAVLVSDKYIRGKGVELSKVNMSYPQYKGVFCKTSVYGEVNVVNRIEDCESTHRYLYGILLKRIKDFSNTTVKYKEQYHAVALSGVRRIGKTTILKQLYNSLENSCYIDGANLQGDMYDLIQKLIAGGIKYIFVDEVCKLDYTSRGELISLIKNGTSQIFFVLTGSVPTIVDNIAGAICYCETYKIPPIMYIEYLAWQQNLTYKEVLKHTNNQKFLSWLKHYGTTDKGITEVKNLYDVSTSLLEDNILLRTHYCYDNVEKAKVRSILYSLDRIFTDDLGIIEVKNRPHTSDKISKYSNLDLENIQEFVLTCNDIEYKDLGTLLFLKACRMRNDIVVLLLELYYIELTIEDNYHLQKPLSLMELYKKYYKEEK